MTNDFMTLAIEAAKNGSKKNHGGPFGAVIVKNNKVISKAHNKVLKNNDPTAHAEIQAIRKASKKLKTHNLKGCTLYATCEPCPMCYAAIHWARIKIVYFSGTRKDAAKIGFDDKELYDELKGKSKKTIKEIKIKSEYDELLKEWKKKKDKTIY